MKTFFDSSAFAKRYVEESGSDKAAALCLRATALGLSVTCVPEIISALNRCRREHRLTSPQYDAAKQRLLDEIRDADIVNLTPAIIESSLLILETNNVRAMDALHVACALNWEAELFVSSDKRQLGAAKRAGLKTERI